jgi:hypothetical protein
MSTALQEAGKTASVTFPALITGAGKRATWRFVEFFTVNIMQNKNTRAAYGRERASARS